MYLTVYSHLYLPVCLWGTRVYTSSQVYTVGPDYAHAEARKSPALDGKVERDSEGKEVRYPVILNAREKLIAWKVCLAFKVSTQSEIDISIFSAFEPITEI